jgi:hypothetical protein
MISRSALSALTIAVLATAVWFHHQTPATVKAQEPAPAATKTPADGYTVHVSAPHLVNGKVMGPFHHYCKVMSDDPKIVCLIYDNTDPNAMLTQVEWIWAKKLTRPAVPLAIWNKNWHDHAGQSKGSCGSRLEYRRPHLQLRDAERNPDRQDEHPASRGTQTHERRRLQEDGCG